MPFQSEKQRRYLWANEPEIARDWTDTYGSKIHAANGGIMRLPFGNGKGVDYDDHEMMIKVEELRREDPDTYGDNVSDEEIIEFIKTNEGGETIDNTSWYKQPNLERMWNDPGRPDISEGLGTMKNWATDKLESGINWGRKKIGSGIDLGRMAMRGIGNFMAPGLGFALGALPRETAAQKFNKSFTVGGANMPNDPYGYYNQLRHGNLNQDPFGRNPVSLFGNYSKNLLGDVNYEGENKFNLAKKNYAQNYFNQKAAEYAPQEDININVTPASLGGGNKGNQGNVSGGYTAPDRGDYDGRGHHWAEGGLISLWPR